MKAYDHSQDYIGAIMLPLRLVAGWLFFSAFWRRIVLVPEKHVMDSAQWLGHKINTFYPHSNGFFKSMLGQFLENPDAMNVFTWVFTLSELVAGLLLIFGFLSRLTGLLLLGLAVGLMHTAGWLGPTCLDEWQISSLLTAIGLVITLFGSGKYSLDGWFNRKNFSFTQKGWWKILTDPLTNAGGKWFRRVIYSLSLVVFIYVLAMNQVHHGGVWGKLHNYSKKPDIQVTEYTYVNDSTFRVNLYRDKGPETHGTFLIQLDVMDAQGDTLHTFRAENLKSLSDSAIENQYINTIHTGPHSLVVPLGAKGGVTFQLPEGKRLDPDENYSLVFTGISGKQYRNAGSGSRP